MTPLRKCRRKAVLFCGLAITVVLGVLMALWPREPYYEGRPLSYWLDYLPVTLPASSPVGSTGAPSQYDAADSAGRRSPAFILQTSPSKGHAVIFLSSLQPADANTVGGADSPLSAKAGRAVMESGPRGLPVLFERLSSRETAFTRFNTRCRKWCASIHLLHPPPRVWTAKTLAPVSEYEIKRGQAITALVELGQTAKPLFESIVNLAKTCPDPGVRASASEVLRRLSPADYAKVSADRGSGAGR